MFVNDNYSESVDGRCQLNQKSYFRKLFFIQNIRDERAARFFGFTRNPTRPVGLRADGFKTLRVKLGRVTETEIRVGSGSGGFHNRKPERPDMTKKKLKTSYKLSI